MQQPRQRTFFYVHGKLWDATARQPVRIFLRRKLQVGAQHGNCRFRWLRVFNYHPWFRIRGRVSGECPRKTLRRNILTTSANFSTPQVANLNATWELSIPILFDFKLTCFDFAWHGACGADFDPHDLFEKSANEKRRRRRLEFVMRSLDCSHLRPRI